MNSKYSDSFWSGLGKALCIDLPYILDSIWRRTEFEANRVFAYNFERDPDGTPAIERLERRFPVFWLFVTTLIFFVYGPTFDALCSIVGTGGMRVIRYALCGALFMLSVYLALRWLKRGRERAGKRIENEKIENTWRALAIILGTQVGAVALVVPFVLFGAYQYHAAQTTACVAAKAGPALWQLGILIVVVSLARQLARRTSSSLRYIAEQAILFASTAAALFLVTPDGANEAQQGPYIHVYGWLVLAAAVTALLAQWIARKQLASFPANQAAGFQGSLATVELFSRRRVDPEVTWRRAVAALTVGSLSHPLHLFLLPAFLVLMVPTRWIWYAFIGMLLLASLLLMIGSLSSRWQQMVLFVKRWFLNGTPLAVSIVVIAIAALRLAQVQYASTILDAAPFGVIFMWVAMAYVLFWWFEYAINSALSDELLRVLGAAPQASGGRIAYAIDPKYAHKDGVDPRDRIIALHGASRYVAMGWFVDHKTTKCEVAFNTFGAAELLTRLMPEGGEDVLHDLNRRIQLYFLIVNVVVLGWGLAYWFNFGSGDAANTVQPVLTAKADSPTRQYSDLAVLLKEQQQAGRPAIIVAASGGGTRAALFTAHTLEGLAKLNVAKDIVLMSGVSGGGVAAAYFFGHQRALLSNEGDAWKDYRERMADPFIQDVLEGAGEWRLVSRETLGVLLAESFERRLFQGTAQRIGSATRPALILNTSIVGHPQDESRLLRGMFNLASLPAQDCTQKLRPYSLLSGGRLIFTNLKHNGAFPSDGTVLPDVRYPFVVVRDPDIPLARAAALNANFPPVFPNARVNVTVEDPACPTRTYFVTDGGATENLGLISALYALKAALRELPVALRPPIHLVAIEASATNYDYRQDRGIGAALNAKERLGGGLTSELLTAICTDTGAPNCDGRDFKLHYLTLPMLFRSRGGFGTHWMRPDQIELDNPRSPVPLTLWQKITSKLGGASPASVTLDPAQLSTLWTALYEPDKKFCDQKYEEASLQAVTHWICGTRRPSLPPDPHVSEWRRLVDTLDRRKP